MSDDLVMRLREPTFYTHPTAEDGKLAADRIEALEAALAAMREERDEAQEAVDANWVTHQRVAIAEAALAAITAEENRLCADLKQAKDRADAAESALAAMTQERDDADEVINKQSALLADAYGAYLDWDEVLKERADHECKARLAKAVDALREIADDAEIMATGRVGLIGKIIRTARATLAEIGGA